MTFRARDNEDIIGQGEEYDLTPPTTEPLYDPHVDESIVFNRADHFMELGFPYPDALELALRRDVDRVSAARYLEQGATHEQVKGILL